MDWIVPVGAADGAAGPEGGEPAAAAADGLAELVPADPAVAVRVELLQPLLELRHRHLPLRRYPPDRHDRPR